MEPAWVSEDAVAFTAADGELLDAICAANNVPTELVMRLLDIERASHGLKRRHAVHTRIEEAFRLEWRDLDTVIKERRAELLVEVRPAHAVHQLEDEPELMFDAEEEGQ